MFFASTPGTYRIPPVNDFSELSSTISSSFATGWYNRMYALPPESVPHHVFENSGGIKKNPLDQLGEHAAFYASQLVYGDHGRASSATPAATTTVPSKGAALRELITQQLAQLSSTGHAPSAEEAMARRWLVLLERIDALDQALRRGSA